MQGLMIDREFARLFPPLTDAALSKLETSLLQQGCLTPIHQWNGVLISSPVRYDLCLRHLIPFVVTDKSFSCREEVISFICTQQLERKTLTEESRRYLLGKLYRANSVINRKHRIHPSKGSTQIPDDDSETRMKLAKQHVSWTAWRLGKEYAVRHGTIEKFGRYSRVLDRICDFSPTVFSSILSGQIHIAVSTVISLLDFSDADLRNTTEGIRIMAAEHGDMQLRVRESTLKELLNAPALSIREIAPLEIGIKTMPAYDPDAEINSLSFTVPTWASSLASVREAVDLSLCTQQARATLARALRNLKREICRLQQDLKYQKNNEVTPDDTAAGGLYSPGGIQADTH